MISGTLRLESEYAHFLTDIIPIKLVGAYANEFISLLQIWKHMVNHKVIEKQSVHQSETGSEVCCALPILVVRVLFKYCV